MVHITCNCNVSHNSQHPRMCLLNNGKMAPTQSQATLEKLQSVFVKQDAYFSCQGLKDLTEDELGRYLSMRNACVFYIKASGACFDTSPEVFPMAVGILDVFLWKVKVTEKHMTIVSAACYLLAAKIKDDEEKCPSPRQLSSLPFNTWTSNDLCRMEMHILKKLDWTLSSVTYLDFLPILADLYDVNRNVMCCDRLLALAERFIVQQSTIEYKPFVLAVSLFHLATEMPQYVGSQMSSHDYNHLIIKDSSIFECRKVLVNLSSPTHAFPLIPVPRRSVSFPVKLFDKPSEMGSTCLPTISEE